MHFMGLKRFTNAAQDTSHFWKVNGGTCCRNLGVIICVKNSLQTPGFALCI